MFHTYISQQFVRSHWVLESKWVTMYLLWTHARNYTSTPIYTKTFQVTVGQLHCFEIKPLGTFSMLDAPDPCTFARSNCWKPFSLQSFEFQTAPLWTIEHLHQETSSTKTPSTSKAMSLPPWKKSSKLFCHLSTGTSTSLASRKHLSAFNGCHQSKQRCRI